MTALAAGMLPGFSRAAIPDVRMQRALALLNAHPCSSSSYELAQVTPTPLPSSSPTFPPAPLAPGQLYSTPFPAASAVTPPPVPTPTPLPSVTHGPVFLTRPSATPSIVPAGSATPSASPTPLSVPTLQPGYVAAIADKLVGNSTPGQPADLIGNVHVYYQDEVLISDRAHYDGRRYITMEGNPYIVNTQRNSIYHADAIVFDTLNQRAELKNGRGESSEGVERGLVYFSATDLTTDQFGVAHGDNAYLTTCERPRAGYHITGRTINVHPGDRIVISKAVLWLGAAAVFYLPQVVIPLRRLETEAGRQSFFPELGYNSYQGFYVKARIGFGRDQYYTGYYRVEFYTREGWGLGYTGTLTKRNGKRQSTLDLYGIHDRRVPSTNFNANFNDVENFSYDLRGQFGFAYNSNFGPLINLPPNRSFTGTMVHSGLTSSQTYTYRRNSVGSVSSQDNFGYAETRTFARLLQNTFAFNLNRSDNSYGNVASSNTSSSLNDQLHWANRIADYSLTFLKSYARTPYGLNKEPELQITPLLFAHNFGIPITPTFTIGNYNEPATPRTTSRANMSVTMGPALYRILGSDVSETVSVAQYAYGTGDLKASIEQRTTVNTPIGSHIANAVTYSENNYNGPAFLPFSTLDQQPTTNYKNAADVLRIFNGDSYNLALNFSTFFNRTAQPVSYQLGLRPSRRSYAALSGTFYPGPGQGFNQTQVQFSTPFGNGSTLQFLGFVDWKNKARIFNKNIYYSRIIGDCYEIQVQYNEAARQVNFTISLLAFPSRAANFGLNTTGAIIPVSLNGGI